MPTLYTDSPIGVFDSGLGGLSVLKAITALLPREHYLYLADAAHLPYGDKSTAYVAERAMTCTRFLVERGAKALVVACNTATAAAVQQIRAWTDLPVIGMEPALKPAARLTHSGVVGVMVTSGTMSSQRYSALLSQHGHTVKILTQPCPGLVERIEAGAIACDETRRLLKRYLDTLMAEGADTLVLGCTHYPFLIEEIRRLVGDEVTLIETGEAVARQLARRLAEHSLLSHAVEDGRVSLWTSGDPVHLRRVAVTLWDYERYDWGKERSTCGQFQRA